MSNLSINVMRHSTPGESKFEYTLGFKLNGRFNTMTLYSTDSTQDVLDVLQEFIDSFKGEVIDTWSMNSKK